MKWFQKRWIAVLLHILFWLILFTLPFLLRPGQRDGHQRVEETGFLYLYISNCFLWITLFYSNAYLLFPKFIITKKYKAYTFYVLLLLLLIAGAHTLSVGVFLTSGGFNFGGFVFFFLFPCLFFLACSTAYIMFIDRLQTDRVGKERENENLKTELAFLRSQVSPHFMFNVLNNMVALARKKSDELEPSLIKLSSLLRYMLYETDVDKVLLEKEVEYLQSYIDLQMQRFKSKIKVAVELDDFDASYFIEPMLLIPFVENAFKHGTGMVENAAIHITMKAKNNLLQFQVSNAYNSTINEIKDKTCGIGLQNVQRRLNLLYKNNHSLLITDSNNMFIVSLQINIH